MLGLEDIEYFVQCDFGDSQSRYKD